MRPSLDEMFAQLNLAQSGDEAIFSAEFAAKLTTSIGKNAIRLGQMLLVAKSKVKDGEWEQWLEGDAVVLLARQKGSALPFWDLTLPRS